MIKKLGNGIIVLRKAKKEDTTKIYENVWSSSECSKMMFWDVTKSYEEACDRMDRTIKYQKENDAFFVCLSDTDEPIGFCGIKDLGNGKYEESGICIGDKFQNKGYGKETVKLLLEIVFDIKKGNEFIYGSKSNNKKSIGLATKMGFEYIDSEKKEKCIIKFYKMTKEKYKEVMNNI